MVFTILCVSACLTPVRSPLADEASIAAIRNAYESNRVALDGRGMIRFRYADGNLGAASSVDRIDALLKTDWGRRSIARGFYAFDGSARRLDLSYPPEDLVARRTMVSKDSWTSNVCSLRVLTDGETTLRDNVDVMSDNKTIIHSAQLRAGTKPFFYLEEIPLDLGNPDPPPHDLGHCLAKVMEGRGDFVLVEVDAEARHDGVRVVKLRIDEPAHQVRQFFWVDLEHGAVPLQTRVMAHVAHTNADVFMQINHGDVRWMGKGWLPFRRTVTLEGDLSPDGALKNPLVRELVIEEADLEHRPDRSVMTMEFPKEFGEPDHKMIDSDRYLVHPARRVWDLAAISPAATARAKKIGGARSPGNPPPELPGPTGPGSWWPIVLIAIGVASILSAGALRFRRFHRNGRA